MLIKKILSSHEFDRSGQSNGVLISFLNPYSYLLMRNKEELYGAIDVFFCDGVLLSKLMCFTGRCCERISFDMTSLANQVFSELECEGKSVYFIGAEPGVVEKFASNLRESFPQLNVKGFRHGFFESGEERARVVGDVAALNPDVIIAGMGTPAQEKFLADMRGGGWTGVGYTCGGFLHQTARGGMEYYPKWMDRFNLRWLYRMIDEPKLIRRYAFYYPKFVLVFSYDLFFYHVDRIRRSRSC